MCGRCYLHPSQDFLYWNKMTTGLRLFGFLLGLGQLSSSRLDGHKLDLSGVHPQILLRTPSTKAGETVTVK